MKRSYEGLIGTQILLLAAVLTLAGCAAETGPALPRGAAIASEPWQFGNAAGKKLRTDHFEIYTTVADPEFNEKFAVTMEGALREYRALAPAVRHDAAPMRCYIFANRAQWAAFTEMNLGESAGVYLQVNRGGYTRGDVFATHWAGDGSIQTAAHEGFHQFVARNFKDALPPFLEEGIATTFEGVSWSIRGVPSWDLSRNDALAQTLYDARQAGTLVPLRQLVQTHAGEVVSAGTMRPELFYAQCWAFARFLREGEGGRRREALGRFLTAAAGGTLYDPSGKTFRPPGSFNPAMDLAAMERYFGPLEQLEAAYAGYIGAIAKDSTRSE